MKIKISYTFAEKTQAEIVLKTLRQLLPGAREHQSSAPGGVICKYLQHRQISAARENRRT